MAFSKKPSLAVVLVVLILLVTQPAYTKRIPGSNCRPTCYMTCLRESGILSGVFCVGKCLLGICKSKIKTLSNASIQCGISCINSKCANPGIVHSHSLSYPFSGSQSTPARNFLRINSTSFC